MSIRLSMAIGVFFGSTHASRPRAHGLQAHLTVTRLPNSPFPERFKLLHGRRDQKNLAAGNSAQMQDSDAGSENASFPGSGQDSELPAVLELVTEVLDGTLCNCRSSRAWRLAGTSKAHMLPCYFSCYRGCSKLVQDPKIYSKC